jgi:hypothetical protein
LAWNLAFAFAMMCSLAKGIDHPCCLHWKRRLFRWCCAMIQYVRTSTITLLRMYLPVLSLAFYKAYRFVCDFLTWHLGQSR